LEMPAVARWCTLDIPAKRTFTPISKISNEFVEVQGTLRNAAHLGDGSAE
jgi:hypothetical protein